MANEVYTREEVLLQDDTEVTLRSLPINPLKVFMKKLGEMGNAKTEEEGVDEIFALAFFCLSKMKETKDRKQEELGDVLDLPTAYKVIEVCGGVKLNDPKLMEMALALAAQEQTSTT